MRESRYWNPGHETLPRAELDALRLAKLRRLVAWADERVPFQRERLRAAGVSAGTLGFAVRVVPPGTLPRFELKAKTWVRVAPDGCHD